MSKRYRALTGLHYPDGAKEHAKAEAGEPYREVTVAAGDECVGLSAECPICGGDVKAYLSMKRPVIERIPDVAPVLDAKPAKSKAVK
ncbi:MAG TPA: hypothetical protein VFH61_08680 [Thermoleophilia bacterium]|nr:hypothetical protein [Thermoleophilia bacterium]